MSDIGEEKRAGFLNRTALSRLWETLFDGEAEAVEEPHIVVYCSPMTGLTDYMGPYASAIQAMAAADDQAKASEESGAYSVARLAPPL